MSTQYTTPTNPSEVRAYVLSDTHSQNRASSTLLLNVTHSNLKVTRFLEIRVDHSISIGCLKDKLYTHTGTRPDFMTLLLRASEKGPIRAELSDENATLARYGAVSGDWLYVVDDDPHSASANGWLEDTSLVPKYVISEEAYNKSDNTYRAYKRKMREKDPNWSMTSALAKTLNKRERNAVDVSDDKPAMNVGDRAEVNPGGKRGEIRFVGRNLEKLPEGWWVGVAFDEPVGKNDGSVKGVKYFEAQMGYGGLVRPSSVKVGDFPVRDDFESEDEI
eukprot:GFKZ01004237.1.p1 GENE.GFKZ01004237.1~~GFKZ01004237.1.p1  ORF type:complete len:276 (+),score=40.77 GFKZ01004237.1:190-1017(+)